MMIPHVLQAIHATLGTAALCSGTVAASHMVRGISYETWALRFLRYSLIASSCGIALSFSHPDPMRWIAVLGVYVSAVAVIAWKRRGLSDRWVHPFVLGTMGTLCLDAMAVFAHIFRLVDLARGTKSEPNPAFVLIGAVFILGFAVMSGIATRNCCA